MKNIWCRGVVLCGVMTLGWPALAQSPVERAKAFTVASKDRPHIPVERRQALYERAKRSHSVAVKRSLLLPGLGNIYADRVFKGMLLMAGAGMSLGVFAGGAVRNDRLFTISGGAAFLGIYTYAALSSYGDVTAYNDILKKRYKVQLVPALSSTQQGFAVRVDF